MSEKIQNFENLKSSSEELNFHEFKFSDFLSPWRIFYQNWTFLDVTKYFKFLLFNGARCFYLKGFGGGGMTVGVTKDPSNIIGSVGKNVVVGNTDEKYNVSLEEFLAFTVEFSEFRRKISQKVWELTEPRIAKFQKFNMAKGCKRDWLESISLWNISMKI